MTDACIVDYKGKRYYFKNTNNEEYDIFLKRCWFLAKHNGKQSFDILNMLSHAWINIRYYGTIYDKKINNLLQKLEE